ncbi:hypothetical protein EV424DRAFT_1372038 [Suillus variegatus]|nr:hypothetical protein EV424DRAFT_1372038 [Suillus variegatus]
MGRSPPFCQKPEESSFSLSRTSLASPLVTTLLSIIPHAVEVERLFSDMGSSQSLKRCNLLVDTFEALTKTRANIRHYNH